MRLHNHQTSLVAGMLDEAASARTETALYRNGASELLNCIPLVAGGQVSRWGSRFCGRLPGPAVLEPFVFSLDQAYVAAFMDGAVLFYFSPDGAPAGGLAGCPWGTRHLAGLRFCQVADVMWVTHPDLGIYLIRRVAVRSWSLEPLTFDSPRATPFFRYADPRIRAGRFGVEVHFSAPWLTPAHFGTALRMYDKPAAEYRHGLITVIEDSQRARVEWLDEDPPPEAEYTLLWSEQAFSPAHGGPRAVAMHGQRLVLAGSRDVGDALWFSAPGRFFNFDLGTAADGDGIAIALGARRITNVQHAVSGPQLTFFTEAGAFYIPEGEGSTITPASIRVKNIGPFGAAGPRPEEFDGAVLFVQSQGNAVRELVYSSEADNLTADPVSLPFTEALGIIVASAHLPASLDRPESLAFFVRDDGRIALYHSVRAQKITAWSLWETQGSWRTLAVSAGRVFATVDRPGIGLVLEVFEPGYAFDCALRGRIPLEMPHLAGRDVCARWEGDYYGTGTSAVNAQGRVTIEREQPEWGGLDPGSPVELGLPFAWRVRPLPPVIEMPDGSLVNRVQRLVRTGLRLFRARAAQVGADGVLVLLSDGFAAGTGPPARTGWWSTTHLGWNRVDDDAQLCPVITRDVPMPTGVLAIKREVVV